MSFDERFCENEIIWPDRSSNPVGLVEKGETAEGCERPSPALTLLP